MSLIRRHSRIVLVALSCVALGAGASAIASAGAATSTRAATGAHQHLRGHGLKRWGARAVEANVVVATKHGFATVSFDRGKVDSVKGQQLTITEGTRKESYKTVTLTIPPGSRVRDNHRPSTLSSLAPGRRVIVVKAPKRTFVIAHSAKQG